MTILRVTLVGPAHPYRGGIASHTARLATELESQGIAVTVESWRNQYPKFLRAGSRAESESKPELPQPSAITEQLTWYNPFSWWQAGRRARGGSLWVSYVTPYQVPFYVVMRLAFGGGPSGAILHNVLPHERGRLDRLLLSLLLASFAELICHDERGAQELRSLRVDAQRIHLTPLPAALVVPAKPRAQANFRSRKPSNSRRRLLFFGFVRNYKGLDILYEALSRNPEFELWVAGDFWESRQRYDELAKQLSIESRLEVFADYIAKSEIPDLFACCDALILPYRSGTATALRVLGHSQGLPVVATQVGAISQGIEAGVDGYVVPAGDAVALATAIEAIPQLNLDHLRATAPARELALNAASWQRYALLIAGVDK